MLLRDHNLIAAAAAKVKHAAGVVAAAGDYLVGGIELAGLVAQQIFAAENVGVVVENFGLMAPKASNQVFAAVDLFDVTVVVVVVAVVVVDNKGPF